MPHIHLVPKLMDENNEQEEVIFIIDGSDMTVLFIRHLSEKEHYQPLDILPTS